MTPSSRSVVRLDGERFWDPTKAVRWSTTTALGMDVEEAGPAHRHPRRLRGVECALVDRLATVGTVQEHAHRYTASVERIDTARVGEATAAARSLKHPGPRLSSDRSRRGLTEPPLPS
jgi:hypothetical protein